MGEDDPPPAMEGTARLFVRVVATPASVAPAPRVDAPEEPTKVRSRPAQRAPSADIMISFRAVKRI
jgi:hypothetical protein